MKRVDRRLFLQSGLLAGGALAAFAARPGRARPPVDQARLDRAIPDAIGPYRGEPAHDIVLAPQDELSDRIYDRYIARAFQAPDQPRILLVAAYGATQDYRLQLHRPESCYPASGWALAPSQAVMLPIAGRTPIPGVTMTATRPGRSEQVLYWTRIGDAFPVDRWAARRQILVRSLQRDPPDGVILRLSMPDWIGGSAIDRLAAFNRALLARMSAPARDLFLGPAS